MTAPFLINMHPHPTVSGRYHSLATTYRVTRAGVWCGDFPDANAATVFVNAMTYIEEVKASGHLAAYPAFAYLLRNTTE